MGMLEENYIYHLIQEKCKLYLRYIDDIFLIWIGTLDELNKFKANINQVHPSIRFDFNYTSNSANFLDTTVKKSSTGKLATTLFKKEADFQAYFHRKSEHPESLKRNIAYAQVLPLKLMCTEDRDFKANCDIFRTNLSIEDIKRQYIKKQEDREDLLTQNNEPKYRIPLTLTYNRTLPNVKEVVKKHWTTLQINNEFLKTYFQNHQLCASVETKI